MSAVIVAELGLGGKIVGKTTDAASAAQLSAIIGEGFLIAHILFCLPD
jgi:hypothetical protein